MVDLNALLVVDIVVTRPVSGTAPGGAGEVLLVRRAHEPFAGSWALPGGKVRPTEDLTSAARRELVEETGIDVTRPRFRTVFAAPGRDPRARAVSAVFTATVAAGTAATAGTDAAEARWFPLPVLSGGAGPALAFDHRDILAYVLDAG